MGEIALDYAVPCADLADYVTLFYNFNASVPAFEDTERADHAQLRFRLSPGSATYSFADGRCQEAPELHLIGPTSGACHVLTSGPVHVFGLGLTPAGWGAVVGTDASEMLDKVDCAVRRLGHGMRQTAQKLASAATIDEMVAIVEPFIRARIGDGKTALVEFMHVVDDWLASSPSPQVEDLVAATTLSRRQVERRCNALYGAPPKLLARKYRALRAAVAMVHDGETLDELMARGFYDQSHLIRELKHFTGLTPGQMRAHPNPLALMTITSRQALSSKVSPLVSRT